jgi:cytochrome c biogenesis protein CcmG/thiol:disulfide interchange protein DsbE
LTTFGGAQISSEDLRGQVVVVNFWASWCLPCEEEAAELEATWREYQERGVVFLGVNYVDTEPEAMDYMRKFDITYPSGPDLGTRIAQAFRIRGVPETFVINGEGVIVSVMKGPYSSQAEVEQAVEIALGG